MPRAYNPARTPDGYYRRTPYKGEGGISFGDNEVARGDRVARVCTRTADVFVVQAVRLPRVELGFDDQAQCPCAPGFFRGTDACGTCPAGYYTDVANMLACVPCGLGEYAPTPNSTACKACPLDKPTTFRNASTSRDACAQCPGGKNGPLCQCNASLPFYNHTTKVCTACPSGWEFRVRGGAAGEPLAECHPCDAGSALVEGKCTLCAAGKYGSGVASTACTECAHGDAIQYRGETASEACVSCLPGTFRAGTQCFRCAGGRTSVGQNATRCVCPGGFAAATPAFRAEPETKTSVQLPAELADATCMPQLRAQGVDSERLVAVLVNPGSVNPNLPMRFVDKVWIAVLHASLQLDGAMQQLQKPTGGVVWEVEPFWNSLTHTLSVYHKFYQNPDTVWELLDDNLVTATERWVDVQAVGVASGTGVHMRLSHKGLLHVTTQSRSACNATYQVIDRDSYASVHQRMAVTRTGTELRWC